VNIPHRRSLEEYYNDLMQQRDEIETKLTSSTRL
jgi:hypothetical protein